MENTRLNSLISEVEQNGILKQQQQKNNQNPQIQTKKMSGK